ncbi:MAG TPA: hypothetical protein VIK74_00445, partial [Parasegetibacter sp.]
ALFHAAKPEDGTFNTSGDITTIPSRFSVQGGVNFDLAVNNTLTLSSAADFQGENNVVSVGVIDKIGVESPNLRSVNVGLWNRFGDAIIPVVGLETEKMMDHTSLKKQ